MGKKQSSQLARALRKKLLVRFTRPLEPGWVNGYVLGIGPRFLLVALVSDNIRFNGFQCFRLSDVRNLQVPDKHVLFFEAALKKRGEVIPKRPSIQLDSIEELLLSANRAFPLITIHREKVDPDVCNIGRIVGLSKGHVALIEIDDHAKWEKVPEVYQLNKITRVDFGGDYEDALHIVGGNPPLASV